MLKKLKIRGQSRSGSEGSLYLYGDNILPDEVVLREEEEEKEKADEAGTVSNEVRGNYFL